MMGAFTGHVGIDHVDGGLVITVENHMPFRRESQLSHDGMKALGMLGRGKSCHEFSLGRAGGSD